VRLRRPRRRRRAGLGIRRRHQHVREDGGVGAGQDPARAVPSGVRGGASALAVLGTDGAEPARARPRLLAWLDDHPSRSVLYVSLGSVACVDRGTFVEMAWGLARSGCRSSGLAGRAWSAAWREQGRRKLGGRAAEARAGPAVAVRGRTTGGRVTGARAGQTAAVLGRTSRGRAELEQGRQRRCGAERRVGEQPELEQGRRRCWAEQRGADDHGHEMGANRASGGRWLLSLSREIGEWEKIGDFVLVGPRCKKRR
jgi:hypothetical protein